MNWMCPVDGTAEVWESPMAAVNHVQSMRGRGHGEVGSIVRGEDEVLWPEPTDENANMESVSDEMEKYPFLPDDIESMIHDLEKQGWETPPILTQFDSDAFSIFDASKGIENDIDKLERELDYIDRVVSMALRNIHNVEQGKISEEPDSQDDEDDEDDEVDVVGVEGGQHTTADLKEAEEEEVMRILRRSTFLDQHSDDIMDTFKVVYRERDSEGTRVGAISNELGVPDGMVEENLEILIDKNLIEWNTDEDLYYVPY